MMVHCATNSFNCNKYPNNIGAGHDHDLLFHYFNVRQLKIRIIGCLQVISSIKHRMTNKHFPE